MQQTRKFKLCLVGDSLSGGGAERAHASLSKFFVSKGIIVHNIIVQDLVSYDFAGELLNLGKLKNKNNDILDKLKRLWVLKKYIRQHKFDYIIDFRMRRKPLQDLLIAHFVYTSPAVFSVRHSNIEWYMPGQTWLTKLIYGKSYAIVSINNKMKAHIEERHGLKNVVNIYNPVPVDYIKEKLSQGIISPDYSYILGVGRMNDNIKQFDGLIKSYAESVLPAHNIRLVILGQGAHKEKLKQYCSTLDIADKVVFMGFQDNPYIYMKSALFFVLSSQSEGTPNVVLESLASGIPVVAFNCFTGPSEIIDNEVNGLLIDDQDFEKLTIGMNRMFKDTALYNTCRRNAVTSIDKFSIENIGQQWLELLKIES